MVTTHEVTILPTTSRPMAWTPFTRRTPSSASINVSVVEAGQPLRDVSSNQMPAAHLWRGLPHHPARLLEQGFECVVAAVQHDALDVQQVADVA